MSTSADVSAVSDCSGAYIDHRPSLRHARRLVLQAKGAGRIGDPGTLRVVRLSARSALCRQASELSDQFAELLFATHCTQSIP